MAISVPWLRLVYDGSVASAAYRKPQQLSLPFPQSDVVLLFDTKRVGSKSFLFALKSVRPHWVLDFRFNPRLDVLAGSRRDAFRYFHDLDLQYVDVFGLLDPKERTAEIRRKRRFVSILKDQMSRSVDNGGPYLALLDDDSIKQIVANSATDVITTLTGRPTALSQLAIGVDM